MKGVPAAQQLKIDSIASFITLRLSVTDVCNLNVRYCLPDGYKPSGQKTLVFLSVLGDQTRCKSVFCRLWYPQRSALQAESRVCVKDFFLEIIHTAASTPGIEKVATTTTMATAWRNK
ncbi:hypothetical protein O9929_10325 [Vibrio lentus]|nr:hypothetical protein [Vibrio lentus]